MSSEQVKPKRNETVDCLKGYACILVVFGHVILGIRNAGVNVPCYSIFLEKFIWSFHMALFFFLSGYVYKITGEWKSKKSRMKFIVYKAINLGIPYFVFSAIYISINSLVPGANHGKDINQILLLWKQPVAQYWFLYALFILFFTWTILSSVMKNWQILTVLYICGYIVDYIKIDIGVLHYGFSCAFAFGLGTVTKELIAEKWKVSAKIGIIGTHLIFGVMSIYLGISGKPIIDDIEELIGIVSSIALISLLCNIKGVNKFLLSVNRYSFPIYLLHTIFTAAVRIALLRLGVKNYFVHVSLAMLFGMLIPIIVASISERITALNVLFYPSKTLRKIQYKIGNEKHE